MAHTVRLLRYATSGTGVTGHGTFCTSTDATVLRVLHQDVRDEVLQRLANARTLSAAPPIAVFPPIVAPQPSGESEK